MIASRLLSLAALLVAGSVVTTVRADYGAARHDAAELTQQADQLFHEVRSHFTHAPNYRSLITLSSRLRVEAIHFERALGNVGRVRDLERQLDALDHLAHDLSDEVFDASRAPRYDRFAAHCDPRVAQKLVRSIENTVHCLDDHLADLPARGVLLGNQLPYNPPQYNSLPARPVQWGGSGFSIRFGR